MNALVQVVQDIFSKYGYLCIFQSLHTPADILKYCTEKDAILDEKFLTFLTPTGHVVGRLYHITSKDDELSNNDLEEIIAMFSLYRIPHVDEIISDLKKTAF